MCSANNISGPMKTIANAVVDMQSVTNLNQFNHVKNSLQRTLDLVLSNVDHSKIQVIQDIDPLVHLDNHHPSLLIAINIKPLQYLNEKRLPKFNFFRANYEELNRMIESINWVSELQNLDIEEATKRFYELLKILMKNVPKVKSCNKNFPCWYSNELIKLIQSKFIAKQQYDDRKKRNWTLTRHIKHSQI